MSHRVSRRELARTLAARPRTRPSAPLPRAATIAPLLTSVPFEHHLLSRATFGRSEESLAELQHKGFDAWLAGQLDHDSIDDSAVERALSNIIDPLTAAGPDVRMLYRAMYSRRQLAWRMVHFLNNHFATNRQSTQPVSELGEDESFFKACFTDFRTVLRISATSPAMIDYLDTRSNVVGNPNENYARELMELHTLGVGGGYTEPDVAAASRVFTGWSRVNQRPGGTGTVITASTFTFLPNRHDTGPKSLSLGWSTPGISGRDGYLEGYSLLDFLAAHPNTAARFTRKLCQYFVADDPPAGLLGNVRTAFTDSGGDFKTTLKAIFTDPEFASPGVMRQKVHDGFELIANLVRRFAIPNANTRALNNQVAILGGQPHAAPDPTGHPEIGDEWQGAGNVLPRWALAYDLVYDRLGGVRIPWSALYGTNRPTSGAEWVDELLGRLVDRDVPPTTVAALTYFMNQRLAALPSSPSLSQVLPHVRDLVSIVIRLPESQIC